MITNFIKKNDNYGKLKNTGRPHALTARETHVILRIASNSMTNVTRNCRKAGVNTNIRNVQRILNKSKHIQRKKLKRKPPLKSHHVEDRTKFVCEHISCRKKLRNIIFTDEKKFYLDGVNG
ncbi:hypothetical protein HZH66_002440 [Vespula vulgaris]|uniref:Transposase Tc1-like domain-containing protein n=1 Tax=Vespula vulgaris TaxID=7454 RepID=A0A834KJV1_VESVU|nr:hypothetical protein HZH66_002440 [Vespula vulgaris]